jgi:KAP family P-loop domain
MATDFIEDFPAASPTFDFDLIAQSLVPLLRQDTKGALVLGIHGPWGSGKTTLMQAVRSALEASPGESNPVFVDFNAWKFHEREALWRALILRLVAELRPLASADTAARLDELERSLYQAFIVQEKGPWTVNWQSGHRGHHNRVFGHPPRLRRESSCRLRVMSRQDLRQEEE